MHDALLAWQQHGRERAFEQLVGAARGPVTVAASRVLRDGGVFDPAAVDDAVALVLDHLRRLPGAVAGERSVTPFEPSRVRRRPGLAYVCRLASDRARDVMRQRRRHARQCTTVSWLASYVAPSAGENQIADGDEHEQIRRAMTALPAREREVMRRLLEGQTQASIAAALRVCEGTVSRIRGRAIDRLRALLDC